ncbi:hypothetical protein N8751_01595 [bacterium]|nr:hypothetical protein [bacterium]
MENNPNCVDFSKNQSFGIQQLTRLREDNCYLDVHNESSSAPGEYSVSNHNDCVCEAINTKELSLQQPSTFYRDGYGWTSNNGCNVDNDSKLRNARNLTNEGEINQLFTRPYLTTPYMGRGAGNVCDESNLRSAEDTYQNRQCNTLSGIYIDRFVPQLACIKDNIQNPRHLIPEDNHESWVRGGQPSRQIIRNKDYLKKCGYKFDGKVWSK